MIRNLYNHIPHSKQKGQKCVHKLTTPHKRHARLNELTALSETGSTSVIPNENNSDIYFIYSIFYITKQNRKQNGKYDGPNGSLFSSILLHNSEF